MATNLKEIESSTASEFVKRIIFDREGMQAEDARDWVFRGQRDSRWGLVPNGFRDATTWGDGSKGPRSTLGDQVDAERQVLRDFYVYADAQGLPIPTADTSVHAATFPQLASPNPFSNIAWPEKELLAIAGVAKHHMLPSRLLDWSRKPLVAMYFAADTALREHKQWCEDGTRGTHLAVWALRRRTASDQLYLLKAFGILEFGVPRSLDMNLHLQSGRFTAQIVAKGVDATKTFQPAPLESLVALDGTEEMLANHLLKFTLPLTEAKNLLKLLGDHFISGATIYGGYEGVRAAVEGKALLADSSLAF